MKEYIFGFLNLNVNDINVNDININDINVKDNSEGR
jgi:hypothetical protein